MGTVSYSAQGTVGSGTTTAAPTYPAGIVNGQLLLLLVANKYPPNGPSTGVPPTGFTFPPNGRGEADTGDGPAEDAGATYATAYYKIADGTETGSETVTVTGGNSTLAIILLYTKSDGTWDVAAANGGDSMSDTSWSAAMGTDPGIEGGDLVVVWSAKNNHPGVGASGEALATTGVTYGAMNERFENGTSFGHNVAGTLSDHVVTSGTSGGNLTTYTFTHGSATGGGTVILRLRAGDTGVRIGVGT
jgi:hypothetical protein